MGYVSTDAKQSLLPRTSVRPTPAGLVLRKDPYAREIHHVSIDVGGMNCTIGNIWYSVLLRKLTLWAISGAALG